MNDKNLLVLVIDTNPIAWTSYDLSNSHGKSQEKRTFGLANCMSACIGFINAYVGMSQQNAVAVITAHSHKT